MANSWEPIPFRWIVEWVSSGSVPMILFFAGIVLIVSFPICLSICCSSSRSDKRKYLVEDVEQGSTSNESSSQRKTEEIDRESSKCEKKKAKAAKIKVVRTSAQPNKQITRKASNEKRNPSPQTNSLEKTQTWEEEDDKKSRPAQGLRMTASREESTQQESDVAKEKEKPARKSKKIEDESTASQRGKTTSDAAMVVFAGEKMMANEEDEDDDPLPLPKSKVKSSEKVELAKESVVEL